jgi:hypothetical protein
VWRESTGDIPCVFDQIPNLQNCFTTPNKNLGGEGPQTDTHLPPSPFTGPFFRKSDLELDSISFLIRGANSSQFA